MKNKTSSSCGFTLIELLVVMAIIGVLASIVVVAVNPGAQIAKAKDAKRMTHIRTIANALEAYAASYDAYPGEIEPWGCDSSYGTNPLSCDDGGWTPDQDANWDTNSEIYKKLVGEDYIKSLPTDPINKRISWTGYRYYYYRYEPYTGHATWSEGPCNKPNVTCRYWIGAKLEKPKDPSKPVFRCSDNEELAEGVGCKEVSDWSPTDTNY